MKNRKKVFVVISQSSYKTGCDYALQTVAILKKNTEVILFLLGEPIGWKHFLFCWNGRKKIFLKEKNLLIVRPFFFIIGNRFQFIRNINCFINSLFLRFYLNLVHAKKNKHVWFFEPDYAGVLLLTFSGFFKIYDCVDFFPFFSAYSKKCHLTLLKHAELITANSSVIFNEIKKIRRDVKLVALGFAEDLFKLNKHLPSKVNLLMQRHKRTTVLGFIGGISSRLNFSLLEKVVALLPNLNFVFFGSLEPAVFGKDDFLEEKIAKLQKFPNFYLYPPVEKELIPSLLKIFTFGLIPYNVGNFYNRYSFPMKSMEYLYAGLPIISTEIEELRRFPEFIHLVKNSGEFIKEVNLLNRKAVTLLQKKEMQEIAISQSWDKKVGQILEEVNKFTL